MLPCRLQGGPPPASAGKGRVAPSGPVTNSCPSAASVATATISIGSPGRGASGVAQSRTLSDATHGPEAVG